MIDGLRPDGIIQSEAVYLKKLLTDFSYTFTARTILPSITLPCITTLFLGVPPEEHGTWDNLFSSNGWKTPGLIDLLHENGFKTASFYNWEQLRDVSKPGSTDISFCLNNSESKNLPLGKSDWDLTCQALSILKNEQIDFVFLYLGCVDSAGHTFGWMSREYIETINNADKCVKYFLENIGDDAIFYITADHGGIDFGHGSDSDEEMLIPVISNNEIIEKGEIRSPVSILDIAPSISALYQVDIPAEWQGKIIR